MSEHYRNPEVLVSTEWVDENIQNNTSVAVIEVNTNLQNEYCQGHIPGSIGWDLHTDLEDQVKRDLPNISQLETLLGRSGIDNSTTIILYGDGNNRSATWAFWILKYYRHTDVRLMNGGRKKWVSENRTLVTETPTPVNKTYKVSTPDHSIRAMREYIVHNLSNPDVKLLDTRTYEEYSGISTSSTNTQQSEIYRMGRIPNSIHIPWDDGTLHDGDFKSASELHDLYDQKGINSSHEVVPYCRLGVRASYSWFVLKYLLGYPRVRNYDGSWTEWGNSSGLSIETNEPQESSNQKDLLP